MIRISFSLPLLTLAFIIHPALVYSQDYYVAPSPTGKDTNPGTLAAPWATVQKAANTLVAGDTVYIRAGTYREDITAARSGTASLPITYSGYGNEVAVIRGSGVLGVGGTAEWRGIINITSKNYLHFTKLTLTQSSGFGFYLEYASYIEIRNCITSYTSSSGIQLYGANNVIVDGNDIGYANQTENQQEALSIAGTTNFVVSNNVVHNGGMEGIDAKGGAASGSIFGNTVYGTKRIQIYIDGYDGAINKVDVYDNLVKDPNLAASAAGEDGIRLAVEAGGSLSNVRVFNNVIIGSKANGISLSDWHESGARAPVFSNVEIFNNTVYGNGVSSGGGIVVDSGASYTAISLKNNLVLGNKGYQISVPANPQVVQTANLTSGTPASIFVNPAARDFSLLSSSPAINQGVAVTGLTSDYLGHPRTGLPDIGAYEYQAILSAIAPPKNLRLN